MTPEQNQMLVRRVIDEVENQGNLDLMDELYAPDVVGHAMGFPVDNPWTREAGAPSSLSEFKRLTASRRAAFPDSHTTIELLTAEGDRVMCWTTIQGTLAGPSFGIAPAGKKVTYANFSVVRIAGDKIAEEWYMWNRLGFAQ